MLEKGPYLYKTDVLARSGSDFESAELELSARFLGLQPVAEVPEPGSFILLGPALAALMLLRQRQRFA